MWMTSILSSAKPFLQHRARRVRSSSPNMIHMDIDTHSPPSRRQRIVTVKRARSPEPSSPQDRPSVGLMT
jgi:hypothetical protein